MLQIDHVYEFLYQELFTDFDLWHLFGGVVHKTDNLNINDISIFTPGDDSTKKIFFYDQEPFIPKIHTEFTDMFTWDQRIPLDKAVILNKDRRLPYGIYNTPQQVKLLLGNPRCYNKQPVLVTSERSEYLNNYTKQHNLFQLYYFFHGFAALDWYRGYYALNYNKSVVKQYSYDYITFNRIINNDRSYRIYWVSKLTELGLLDRGQVSFNVTDNLDDDWRNEVSDPETKLSESTKLHAERYLTKVNKLVVDEPNLSGSASADILRNIDALWNVVTETVFYYDKLHLTEKIFKPIAMKQPFMLIAAPGNLAYLKSYGFKTFDGIIDESYDTIQDPDQRIDAVAEQLRWYCSLSQEEKRSVIEAIAPIVEYNFHHFYGEFKHIITRELLDNCRTLFKELEYNDSNISYEDIYRVLTN